MLLRGHLAIKSQLITLKGKSHSSDQPGISVRITRPPAIAPPTGHGGTRTRSSWHCSPRAGVASFRGGRRRLPRFDPRIRAHRPHGRHPLRPPYRSRSAAGAVPAAVPITSMSTLLPTRRTHSDPRCSWLPTTGAPVASPARVDASCVLYAYIQRGWRKDRPSGASPPSCFYTSAAPAAAPQAARSRHARALSRGSTVPRAPLTVAIVSSFITLYRSHLTAAFPPMPHGAPADRSPMAPAPALQIPARLGVTARILALVLLVFVRVGVNADVLALVCCRRCERRTAGGSLEQGGGTSAWRGAHPGRRPGRVRSRTLPWA